MKANKIKTVEDMFEAVEKMGGAMPIIDNYGQVWLIEKLKRQSATMTKSQECLHEWFKEDYDESTNSYLSRRCHKCKLNQRYLTSTGEWVNVGIDISNKGDE